MYIPNGCYFQQPWTLESFHGEQGFVLSLSWIFSILYVAQKGDQSIIYKDTHVPTKIKMAT